jgi:uncharacterized protein
MRYLDTSVIVAALTPEARTPHIQQWLADQDPDDLHVSDWVVTEVSSALSIKLRSAQLDADQRARALAAFTTLLDESIAVLHVSRDDFRTAARFADQAGIGLRAGDALHLAVAGAHGATLYTLDQKLLKAAPAVAVDARSP